MSKTGYMSSLLPTFLEEQNAEIKKNVQALKRYHRRQYYCVNIFKFLLPESKVNANMHTLFPPCYCHCCDQPKVTGVTSGNRDDKMCFLQ